MLVKRISPFSGKENSMDLPITEEQITNWENGMHIQHAFSNLPPEQREFILTGITPNEWNEMFQDEADDI
jgi:hypothetical protein